MTTEIQEIRRGFSWEKVSRFQRTYGLTNDTFARMVGMSNSTLTRHRKQEEPLDAVASDRFYRTSEVIKLATAVFEGKEPAMQWLQRPQPGLNNMIPLELLDTEPGTHAVQKLLTQIEYGVLP